MLISKQTLQWSKILQIMGIYGNELTPKNSFAMLCPHFQPHPNNKNKGQNRGGVPRETSINWADPTPWCSHHTTSRLLAAVGHTCLGSWLQYGGALKSLVFYTVYLLPYKTSPMKYDTKYTVHRTENRVNKKVPGG